MHIPGQTAHLVRRCRNGQYLLRPDRYTNAVMAYEILHAATRHGLELSGVTVMSNHYHLMGIDTDGDRAAFMGLLNRNITRRLRHHHGYQGSTWMPDKYVDVHIGRAKELQTLVYIWTNPVKDGLVDAVDQWPGFQILPDHWGKQMVIKKPDAHYGRTGPKEVKFTPQPPGCLRHLPLETARRVANRALKHHQAKLVAARHQDGKTFLGRDNVLATDPMKCAKRPLSNRGPKNRFSFGSKSANAIIYACFKAFQEEHEVQRQRWLKGLNAVFPCGTVKLQKHAPVQCRPVPDDQPGLYRPETDKHPSPSPDITELQNPDSTTMKSPPNRSSA